MHSILSLFTANGGEVLTSPEILIQKASKIRAYLFDWDGVFTDGSKFPDGSSSFSELDSMGINLLRFGHWLRHAQEYAFVGIMTGEKNPSSITLAQREHFDAVYFRIKNKGEALQHLLQTYNLKAEEVAFVFDDVLDLSVAAVAGLRLMVKRNTAPLFANYVKNKNLADYASANEMHSVREMSELLLGLQGSFEEAVAKRSEFSEEYATYFDGRNQRVTTLYTKENNQIVTISA
ncbi:phosphatase [Cytophagaceae bacterium DM2B3-1]|uniref:Phosphatase n=1 Tax=Xanthocytophaga flava TaxID=3048013 RepID=A0ABT7CK67_9BACT|nr:phosphatase [Xanthocytophaga flavus]MDJ1493417.1 phosphatase [Xanthocytophaga flavus]